MLKWQWLVALAFPIILKIGDAWIVQASSAGEYSQVDASRLPLQFGEWTGSELDPSDVIRKLMPWDTVIQRTYTNRRNETLFVSLVYSNQWESLHPPQDCLKAGGYEIVRETTVELGGEVRASVISASKSANSHVLELYLFTDASRTSATWLERYGEIMVRHGRAAAQSSCLFLVTRQYEGKQNWDDLVKPVKAFATEFLPHIQSSLQPSGNA